MQCFSDEPDSLQARHQTKSMDRRTRMNKPLISIALGAMLLAGTASRAHADNDYSRAEQRADRQDARADARERREDIARNSADQRQENRRDRQELRQDARDAREDTRREIRDDRQELRRDQKN